SEVHIVAREPAHAGAMFRAHAPVDPLAVVRPDAVLDESAVRGGEVDGNDHLARALRLVELDYAEIDIGDLETSYLLPRDVTSRGYDLGGARDPHWDRCLSRPCLR